MSHEWAWPVSGVAVAAIGIVISRLVKGRRESGSGSKELAATFDKHAPAWRTCTCESCADRRKQAGL